MKQNILLFIFIGFCLSFTQIVNAQSIIKDDFLVNDDDGTAHQNYPSISMDAAGNFIIVWRDFRNGNGDIYYQRYNNVGTALEVNKKVNDDTESASQGYTSISMDGAGNYVIVWDDDRYTNYDTDIYYQRYTSTGAALGVNTKVNHDIDSVKQWDPTIAMDITGNYVVVWVDERNGNSDIYLQRFTSTGAALGVNTKVNDDGINADQVSPSISMDALGNFVITWQDFRNSNWDVYYQRYTDTGTGLGTNTKVNDDVNEFQYYPSISMDASGNFIIVWQDFRNANWDIYFQRYTDTGTTLGVNTKVNDDAGSAYQKIPSIYLNIAGDFVIVWMDYRYGQTNPDIIGQRYFSTGNPDGSNYRIVADGPNNGESSPVVCGNNNSIFFSWEDNRRSNDWDIYSKIVGWNWNGVTDVLEEENIIPKNYSLYQNYPNPFNPNTKISWQSPVGSWQTIKLFDVLGRELETIIEGYYEAGSHSTLYTVNSTLPSGVYFYQLKAGNFVQTKKMMYLK